MHKNRILWVDTARGISIFLVVLGHTILPFNWLVYVFSFHMPLFFFLSGYLFNPIKYPHWWDFFKRKATTLLLPYAIFFLLNYIYWFFRFNSHEYFQPFWWMVYSSDNITAPFIPLWFLTCLFVLEIYFYFLQKYLKPIFLLMAVIASTFFGLYLAHRNLPLPWGIDISLVVTLFYYAGFMIRNKFNFIQNISLKWLGAIGTLSLVANFLLARYHDYQVSLFYRAYGNIWLMLAAAITGIFAYLALSRVLKETVFTKWTIWEFLGKNSLIILASHTVFYYFVSDFFQFQLHIHPQTSILFAFIYTILTLVLLVPLIYLINMKLPFIFKRLNTPSALPRG